MKQLLSFTAALTIAAGQSYVGRVDTIGGTTYDWQAGGPALRWLALSQGFADSTYGIHTAWMYSGDMSNTTFPDRNMRYNFYDAGVGGWNWPDPDFMRSGVDVFTTRSGYGNVSSEPGTGLAVISRDFGSGYGVGKDVSVGAGVFDNCEGPAGYRYPVIDVGSNGWIHCACIGDSGLYYARCTTWCSWETPRWRDSVRLPGHNIAASKTSLKVCMAWVATAPAPARQPAYYRTSGDGGTTWGVMTQLDYPPAYGGDTVTTFHVTSVFPFYDRERDMLHIVACVNPMLGDTTFALPAEIWHWCPDNQPQWRRIHHAGCAPEHLQAGIGYNAIYADRPSIGEGNDGRLFVAWEQFDSSNVEPQTERLRAGVWVSGSADNGASWTPGLLVTERNTMSHRFPCIIDRALPGVPADTICVLYLMDQVAGFFIYNEGPATPNPVVCQFIPSTYLGIAEAEHVQVPSIYEMTTIVRGVLMLGAGSRQKTADRAATSDGGRCGQLLDALGRKVLDLHAGANDVQALTPGVYFVREGPRAACLRPQATRKVLVVR